ncbi:MAG: FtsX-like permease family protein [Candidatus Thiodiazotropha sp.]
MRWLKFALLNVLRNRRRGVVTILIIAVGCTGILVSGGFALYTYDSLREMSARESGHLILAHSGYFDQQEESPMALGLSDYQVIRQSLSENPAIRAVLPRVEFTGLISNGDKSSVFVGNGVEVDEFKVKGPFLKVVSGSILSSHPAQRSDPQILIGEGLARIMNARVGDSLTLMSTTVDGGLNAQDVVVQGIISLGVPEIDKRILLTRVATAQALLQTDKVSTLSIYLQQTDDTDRMGAEIATLHPELDMQTWLDTAFYYLAVRSLYNHIFGLLGAIILGMVFFAVTNVVSMSVVERTREIGTLRAMGTHPREVIRNFVLEALVMGGLSVILSMGLAAATALIFSLAGLEMPPPPSRSQGYPLIIYVDGVLYLITGVCVLLLCLFAAWFASRKAARKPLVEALNHV